jgi:hypothetical protein
VLAGEGLDFRRGAFQRAARLLQSQPGIPQFQVLLGIVEKREHGLVLHHKIIRENHPPDRPAMQPEQFIAAERLIEIANSRHFWHTKAR